jgi:hypothetical protein
LVVGKDLPTGFGLEDGEGRRRDFFRENDFQVSSFMNRVSDRRVGPGGAVTPGVFTGAW